MRKELTEVQLNQIDSIIDTVYLLVGDLLSVAEYKTEEDVEVMKEQYRRIIDILKNKLIVSEW